MSFDEALLDLAFATRGVERELRVGQTARDHLADEIGRPFDHDAFEHCPVHVIVHQFAPLLDVNILMEVPNRERL